MAKKTKNFDQAYQELLEIQAQIQGDDISVENISKLVKRSTELINFCKERLRNIEQDIDEAFKDE